jgi:hypothetical protein
VSRASSIREKKTDSCTSIGAFLNSSICDKRRALKSPTILDIIGISLSFQKFSTLLFTTQKHLFFVDINVLHFLPQYSPKIPNRFIIMLPKATK